MEYRKLPHGEEQISTIGLGMGNIYLSPDDIVEETLFYAVDHGINLYDMCCGRMKIYELFGHAVAGRRDQVYTQMHFGAVYEDENYGRSRNLELVKRSFDKMLNAVNTDYTDFGYIHCIDEENEFEEIMNNGTWDYVCSLKEQGVVRHLGFSTHTPAMALRFLQTQMMDICMFSLNPAYDYGMGELGNGQMEERARLYKEAERLGVGITVMKPFAGGQLLNREQSPLNVALTRFQCIQYALDRPGVLCCLPGGGCVQDIKDVLKFYEADKSGKDYSILEKAVSAKNMGRCVYCNHCAPCPGGIDIGLVNKYYDLARIGDEFARDHYKKLSVHADACIQCGHCESHCPFHVKQMNRMKSIKEYFSGLQI